MNEKECKRGDCQSFVGNGEPPISQMICKLNDIKGHLEDFRRFCPNATDFQQRMFIAGYMKMHHVVFNY